MDTYKIAITNITGTPLPDTSRADDFLINFRRHVSLVSRLRQLGYFVITKILLSRNQVGRHARPRASVMIVPMGASFLSCFGMMRLPVSDAVAVCD